MAPKIVCINVFQGVGIEGQVELGEYSGDSTETRIKLRANEGFLGDLDLDINFHGTLERAALAVALMEVSCALIKGVD